jgi:hypothetical protein
MTLLVVTVQHTADGANVSNLDAKVVSAVESAVRSAAGSVILDVCLDFFAARNPFRADVSPEFFSLLSRLFAAHSASNATFRECMVRESPGARARFLEHITAALTTPPDLEATVSTPFAHLHTTPECRADGGLQSDALSELQEHLAALRDAAPKGCAVNPQRLVDVGMTTDLPHHESTESEVTALLSGLRHWLEVIVPIRPPAMVTLARSADDGYTPTEIANELQASVISQIRAACAQDAQVIVHTEAGRSQV